MIEKGKTFLADIRTYSALHLTLQICDLQMKPKISHIFYRLQL